MKLMITIIIFLFSAGAVGLDINSCNVYLTSSCLEILDSRISSTDEVHQGVAMTRLQVDVRCKVSPPPDHTDWGKFASFHRFHFIKRVERLEDEPVSQYVLRFIIGEDNRSPQGGFECQNLIRGRL